MTAEYVTLRTTPPLQTTSRRVAAVARRRARASYDVMTRRTAQSLFIAIAAFICFTSFTGPVACMDDNYDGGDNNIDGDVNGDVNSDGDGAERVLEYDVLEETDPKTMIGNVSRDYGLDRKYSPAVLASLRFSFLTLPVGDVRYFSVEEQGGVLRTRTRINREALCEPRTELCVVKFDVAVQPIQYFQIIKVKIEILDINDNAPFFLPSSMASFELSEAAAVGTSFLISNADDFDSAKFGISHYELKPQTDKFELVTRGGGTVGDGQPQIRLSLRERLDRETMPFYSFRIVAVDRGDPPRTGSMAINVTVLDANDNAPTFDRQTYEVRLDESVRSGTTAIKLTAHDLDAGVNAKVAYTFSKQTEDDCGSTFGIRTDTGVIYTKTTLDYETRTLYTLYVSATDRAGEGAGGGEESLVGQTLVVVRVNDINDNAPSIRINPVPHTAAGGSSLGGSGKVANTGYPEVMEGSDVGSFVAHVSVEDKDSGANGQFHCFIADSSLFDLTQMYATEFKVVTLTRFDRELKDLYDLTITCRDNGKPSLSSHAQVKVKIIDRNDHTPLFVKDVYHVTMEENNAVGVSLARVRAVDMDSGRNGEIAYSLDTLPASAAAALSLTTDPSTYVAIDSIHGVITARKSFDRETTPTLRFVVMAADQGEPARSSTVVVHVTVTDVDDEAPKFTFSEYVFVVEENLPGGTEVGSVTATDRDAPPYNAVFYSLNSLLTVELLDADGDPNFGHLPQTEHAPFTVHSITGKISTVAPLDRERRATYSLAVTASGTTDGGTMCAVTATAVVRVGDVNDNRPLLRFPSSVDDRVVISGQSPVGYVFARVTAVDEDAGVNAKLTYSFTTVQTDHSRDNEDEVIKRNAFVIDADTGELRVNVPLTSLSADEVEMTLEVTAVDGGVPELSDTGRLRLTIQRNLAFIPPAVRGADKLYVFLASDDLALALAVALATILVAIAVIIAIICLVRRHRTMRSVKRTPPPGVMADMSEKERTFMSNYQRGSGENDALTLSSSIDKGSLPLQLLHEVKSGCGSTDRLIGNGGAGGGYNVYERRCNGGEMIGTGRGRRRDAGGEEDEGVEASTPGGNTDNCDMQGSRAAHKPVVAFIKDLICENTSPPNSYDSNSDSGRGPSSIESDPSGHGIAGGTGGGGTTTMKTSPGDILDHHLRLTTGFLQPHPTDWNKSPNGSVTTEVLRLGCSSGRAPQSRSGGSCSGVSREAVMTAECDVDRCVTQLQLPDNRLGSSPPCDIGMTARDKRHRLVVNRTSGTTPGYCGHTATTTTTPASSIDLRKSRDNIPADDANIHNSPTRISGGGGGRGGNYVGTDRDGGGGMGLGSGRGRRRTGGPEAVHLLASEATDDIILGYNCVGASARPNCYNTIQPLHGHQNQNGRQLQREQRPQQTRLLSAMSDLQLNYCNGRLSSSLTHRGDTSEGQAAIGTNTGSRDLKRQSRPSVGGSGGGSGYVSPKNLQRSSTSTSSPPMLPSAAHQWRQTSFTLPTTDCVGSRGMGPESRHNCQSPPSGGSWGAADPLLVRQCSRSVTSLIEGDDQNDNNYNDRGRTCPRKILSYGTAAAGCNGDGPQQIVRNGRRVAAPSGSELRSLTPPQLVVSFSKPTSAQRLMRLKGDVDSNNTQL